MSTNVYTFSRDIGRHMREPHTGAYRRTRITVSEICDSERDLRVYHVAETVGVYTVREERFECADYFDMRSGHAEAARELAATWLAEAREDTARRRAAGECMWTID